jgi:TROVE domain-containing protein
MKTNQKVPSPEKTHEGGQSGSLSPAKALRRSVMASMLFEDTFYESGEDAAMRIASLVPHVSFDDLAQITLDAREKFKLRHMPLFLLREALRIHKGAKMGELIYQTIQRPDELGELLALYWKENKNAPLTAQLKIGLARALKKFNEYQLAKWNTNSAAVKLRDVLFLTHAKPHNEAQAALFKRIAENTLVTPDTWETQLSAGADKRATFERLLNEKKLGALALLRNLRGMLEAQVPEDLIRAALGTMKVDKVLPFRFITAACHAPRLEDALETAMFKCLETYNEVLTLNEALEPKRLPLLSGKTALLIDHSGSMEGKVSQKSEISRFDAAGALAMILRETTEHCRVFTFSSRCIEIPPRRGFGMLAAIREIVNPVSTLLGHAVRHVYATFPECNRLIVITDEQSVDRPPHPQGRGYIINVGAYQNGIGYGPWITINGWSEAILAYIKEFEAQE